MLIKQGNGTVSSTVERYFDRVERQWYVAQFGELCMTQCAINDKITNAKILYYYVHIHAHSVFGLVYRKCNMCNVKSTWYTLRAKPCNQTHFTEVHIETSNLQCSQCSQCWDWSSNLTSFHRLSIGWPSVKWDNKMGMVLVVKIHNKVKAIGLRPLNQQLKLSTFLRTWVNK